MLVGVTLVIITCEPSPLLVFGRGEIVIFNITQQKIGSVNVTLCNEQHTYEGPSCRYALIKKTILFGNFSRHGGGGLPKSQNFCKFTKYFFVCKIHSEVLKHVLQMGG